MPLTPDNVSSIRNLSVDSTPIETSINDTLSSIVSDPFSAVISTSFKKINSLVVNIETKIDNLAKEIVSSADSKGRVTLQGNQIVISVQPQDVQQANILQNRIQTQISAVQKTLSTLTAILVTIKAIQTAITIYQSYLAAQEILMTLGAPMAKIAFTVLKKGIKIIFLREILNQYAKVLSTQLAQNQQVLQSLTNRFRDLQVTIKIGDVANTGQYIGTTQAEALLINDLLETGNSSGTTSDSMPFTADNGDSYILKIEKYGDKEIIARAYDSFSGLIKEQTAPSYLSTPDQLYSELQTILNLK
jgi:hypothetical protein